MRTVLTIAALVIGAIILIVACVATVQAADACAAKGGTYITPKNSVPACVKEIK